MTAADVMALVSAVSVDDNKCIKNVLIDDASMEKHTSKITPQTSPDGMPSAGNLISTYSFTAFHVSLPADAVVSYHTCH
jgi:hypothetical protein